MLNLKNKTLTKLISLILAQVFLLTGIVYPESISNKNTSSIYIHAKGLRVPMMGSGGKNAQPNRLQKATAAAKNLKGTRQVVQRGESFYLGDNLVTLDRLIPLAKALEKSLNYIVDRDLNVNDRGEKARLKIGLSIDADEYDLEHPEERFLGIIIKDENGGAVARLKIWPLKLRDGVSFDKKAVFVEWFSIEKEWMKGKSVSDQVLYHTLSDLLYDLGYREIYGYRKEGSEGFWKRMGWKPADVNIYIPGTPGFYIEKPGSVKGHCPTIVDLHRGEIRKIVKTSGSLPQLTISRQRQSNPSQRYAQYAVRYKGEIKKSIRKYTRRLIILGLLGAASYAGYRQFDASQEALGAFRDISAPKITRVYQDDRLEQRYEVEELRRLQANDKNLLDTKKTARIETFLTGGRFDAIKFAAGKFNLEPELVAAFWYEEEMYSDTQNRLERAAKSFLSEHVGVEVIDDYRGTVGDTQISKKYILNSKFLNLLYENKDHFLAAIKSEEELNLLKEFINFYKFWHEDQEATDEAITAYARFQELLIVRLVETEEINPFLTAFTIREIANNIATTNRGISDILDMSKLYGPSEDWVVERYQEVPKRSKYGNLLRRYSLPFGSIKYYYPLMRYFAIAQDYSGAEHFYLRGRAKTEAYLGFLQWGGFKRMPDTQKPGAAHSLHASWALVPEGHYADTMVMSDGREVDNKLIKSLRNNKKARDANDKQVIEIQGYEFYVYAAENGQKFLISKDIIDAMSDSEALAVLRDALSRTGFEKTQDGQPLIISSLLFSPRLFEDCQKNSFIGINEAFLYLYGDNPSQRRYLKILLQVGLEHELRHEMGAGRGDEDRLTDMDAKRIIELCGERGIDLAGLVGFLRGRRIIYADFEKILVLRAYVKRNVDELREKWDTENHIFAALTAQEKVDALLDYIEENPACYVGYGDMTAVRPINKTFTTKIVDRLIPMMVRAADIILRKYNGRAFRIGGDEIGLTLPASLSEEEVNNIRLELQLTLAEFMDGLYGFVKIRCDDDNEMEALNKTLSLDSLTGIYKDRDGYFLVFKKNKQFPANIETVDNKVVEMPSLRASFGIARITSDRDKGEYRYSVASKRAEDILNLARRERRLNGATPALLGHLKEPEAKPGSSIRKLDDNTRKKITAAYAKGELGYDWIEEYYPVVKREYLHSVIEKMGSSAPGTAFLIRGPPDNFYIVTRSRDGAAVLIKIELVYEAGTKFKAMIEKTIKKGSVSADGFRKRWENGWGFKVINDILGHDTGNRVIRVEAEALNEMIRGGNFLAIAPSEMSRNMSNAVNSVLRDVAAKAEVKAIIGIVRLEDLEGQEEPIDIVDDLTKMADPVFYNSRYQSMVRAYDRDKKIEFDADRRKFRAKEREKFRTILGSAYKGPALTSKDLDTYALLYEKPISDLAFFLDHEDNAFKLVRDISYRERTPLYLDSILVERLENALSSLRNSSARPLDFEFLRSKINNLTPAERIRIAYNLIRLDAARIFPVLSGVFNMPSFYDNPMLASLDIIPYLATYYKGDELAEWLATVNFGEFELVTGPVEEGDDYIFEFRRGEDEEYKVRLKRDFTLELESGKDSADSGVGKIRISEIETNTGNLGLEIAKDYAGLKEIIEKEMPFREKKGLVKEQIMLILAHLRQIDAYVKSIENRGDYSITDDVGKWLTSSGEGILRAVSIIARALNNLSKTRSFREENIRGLVAKIGFRINQLLIYCSLPSDEKLFAKSSVEDVDYEDIEIGKALPVEEDILFSENAKRGLEKLGWSGRVVFAYEGKSTYQTLNDLIAEAQSKKDVLLVLMQHNGTLVLVRKEDYKGIQDPILRRAYNPRDGFMVFRDKVIARLREHGQNGIRRSVFVTIDGERGVGKTYIADAMRQGGFGLDREEIMCVEKDEIAKDVPSVFLEGFLDRYPKVKLFICEGFNSTFFGESLQKADVSLLIVADRVTRQKNLIEREGLAGFQLERELNLRIQENEASGLVLNDWIDIVIDNSETKRLPEEEIRQLLQPAASMSPVGNLLEHQRILERAN